MKSARSVLLLSTLFVASCGPPPDPRLNLLIIMTDQQRFDALSAAGNTVLRTPNIDRIANEGVLFEKAYTPVPVCAPARTSILTGQSIDNTGIFQNKGVYDPQRYRGGVSFDMVLSAAGYKTGYYGKWHSPRELAARYDNLDDYPVTATSDAAGLGELRLQYLAFLDAAGEPRIEPEDQYDLPDGLFWDVFSERPYRPDPIDKRYGLSDRRIKKMEELQQKDIHGTLQIDAAHTITAMQAGGVLSAIDRLADEPFSLTVSFHSPHPPYTPAEPHASLYSPEQMPLPQSLRDGMADSPYAQVRTKRTGRRYRNPEKLRHFIANYYGLVEEIDEWVGRILDRLDHHDLTDKTMIVFVSDHGEMLGSHGMAGKANFYEEAVRVPFLIRLPGVIPAATRIRTPVSTRDIFPTVLDFLGQTSRDGVNSRSLRGVIEGSETREFVVSEWGDPQTLPSYMIRSGDWKLLISRIPAGRSVDALYNLEDDPLEMNNLLFDGMPQSHARVAADLRDKLVSWLEEVDSPSAEGVRERPLPLARDAPATGHETELPGRQPESPAVTSKSLG